MEPFYDDLDALGTDIQENLSKTKNDNLIEYADKLAQDFLSLYRSQIKTDLTLVVQSKEFKVHRVILSTRSIYFKELFEEHPERSKIELEEPFNLEAFDQILEYIYGGQITVNTNTVDILTPIAERFRLKELCKLLGRFYGIELTDKNVVEKLVHYHKLDNKRGVQQCLLYIDHIFSTSPIQAGLSKLPFEILIRIAPRKTLQSTETQLFKLMLEWYNNRVMEGVDPLILQKQMQQLAQHLNLYLLCAEDPRPLFIYLRPNRWITDVDLLWDALMAKVSESQGTLSRESPLFKPRKPGPKILVKKNEAFKVPILGLPRAGKTSVMKYFLQKTHPNLPTSAIMVEEFKFKETTIQLRDFNGDEDVRKFWYSEVNKNIDGLIWVIDHTDLREENIDFINEFMDFVGKPNLPVLILAHKSDLGARGTSDHLRVVEFLRITKSMYFSRAKRTILEKWRVVSSSMTGHDAVQLNIGMEWLVEEMIDVAIKKRKEGVISRRL